MHATSILNMNWKHQIEMKFMSLLHRLPLSHGSEMDLNDYFLFIYSTRMLCIEQNASHIMPHGNDFFSIYFISWHTYITKILQQKNIVST